jgi:gliding motility-associated-like protein
VPSTNIPISVTTIHNTLYNESCGSENEQYFGSYFEPPGLSPLAAPIDFNGMTVPMTASSPVIPGHQYHIKLAIADFGPFGYDGLYDSAVFLEGGSFGIGNINLGDDLLQATGNAICPGNSTVLQTDLDPTLYNFQWQSGTPPVAIPGETGPTLTVSAPGTYTLQANFTGTTCTGTQSIVVEYYDPIVPGTPNDLYFCSAAGFGTFDLTSNTPLVIAPLTGTFTVTYYLTQADADAGTNPIATPEAYTNVSNPETIYVRVQNDVTGCYGTTSFQLIVQDLTPQFTLPADFTVCSSNAGTISVTAGNYDPAEATYAWTLNNLPLADTTPTIDVTDNGVYEVTVNFHGCTATHAVNVTVLPAPIAQVLPDVTVCGSFTLQALDPGNVYYDQPGGTGNVLAVNTQISATQTIYIYDSNGTCADESSFTITVNHAVADILSNVSSCSSYTLPALSTGNTYWSASGGPAGGGTQYNAGDVISTVGTTTIWVWAESGTTPNCTDQTSFTVTIGQVTAQILPDVAACDHYILQELDPGNAYWTGPGATGTNLPVGFSVEDSQLIYIHAGDAGCSDESSFFVTITDTPVLTAIQGVTACDSYTLPSPQAGAHYYSQSGGVGQLGDNEVITTPGDTTIYEYASAGSLPNLCTAETSFTVSITQSPSVADIDDVSACDSYMIPAPAVGAIYTQSGGQSAYDITQAVTQSGTFYVYASNGQCSDEDAFTVTISPSPAFTVESGCQGSVFVLTVNPTNGFDAASAEYQWSAGDGGQIVSTQGASATVSGAATYNVVVTSGACTSSSQAIAVDNTGCLIQKGISPNGDGMNDFFDLVGQNVSHLEIFNRYGTKVYEKADYSNQWVGQSDKGESLPDGVYYYVITYTAGQSKTGWIYINREQN